MLSLAKISEEQAQLFRRARDISSPDIAKTIRARLWDAVRKQYGLPAELKLKVAIDSEDEQRLVIRRKDTGVPIAVAQSGMPYTKAPIANVIPYLNSQGDGVAVIPADALPIGGGLFAKDGFLYFPSR